jgi:integrase
MASVKKRNSKSGTRWDVTVTKRGAPRMSRTFQTRSAAERWAREVERDIERGAWQSTELAERTTAGELFARYEAEIAPGKKDAKSMGSMLRCLQKQDFARLSLIALTPEILARYRDRRLNSPAKRGGPSSKSRSKPVSSQTVRHEMALVSRVIGHALKEWGLHLPAGNPATKISMPSPSKARDRRLEGWEYQRLLEAAETAKARALRPVIEFAVESAMRRGEICALYWSDIDLKRRVAHARETKNDEPRTVPLSTRAIELLERLPRPIRDEPVFGFSPGGLTQAFGRVCERAGIQNLRFHDLRHEGTSRLAVKLNGDVMALSAITGHKTLQMLKRYTHLRAEDLALRIA